LWTRALERYLDELEGSKGHDHAYQKIIASEIEARSIEDVLEYAKTLESILPQQQTLASLGRLSPTLKVVDDFAAVIAICFGADAKLTAFLWGSIRIILTLSSSAGDNFREVLDMLEELSMTLPRFRIYEQTLPMDKALETALLDVYTEIICFYARTIHFFRRHPHTLLVQNAWADLRGDFGQTLRRIKRMSAAVESEADQARMRKERNKYAEVLDVLKALQDSKISGDTATPQCYLVPYQPNTRFWGREQALQEIKMYLAAESNNTGLKTFALYGMGGVGKTQIALRYAEIYQREYDAVLWVTANNWIGVAQSMQDIAQSLGLIESNDELKDMLGATLKVKNWLQRVRMYFCFLQVIPCQLFASA
jgi:NB-ARC domain